MRAAGKTTIDTARMLKPHGAAPLEYWFFKVNHQSVALLVDWICRRRRGEGLLRVTIHSPVAREVLSRPHPAILKYGAPELTMLETSWRVGGVRWHLTIQPSPDRIRPQVFPAEQLKLFDMSLESAPSVVFDGWIEHRGERFSVASASGMISHYWGRGLPPTWWWVSANQFDTPHVTVECTVLRSRVLGTSLLTSLGYLYYRNGNRTRLIVSPPGRLKAIGSPDSFQIQGSSILGPPISLKAAGREYASLGEGIVSTLTGDLEVWEGPTLIARARSAAGLERRAGPG